MKPELIQGGRLGPQSWASVGSRIPEVKKCQNSLWIRHLRITNAITLYDQPVLPALVLAGGASSRMGTPKALLTAPDGRSFVARVVSTLAAAGVTEIVVVTGVEHEAIVSMVELERPPIAPRFVRNPDPSRGQLSSLWVGLDAVEAAETGGILTTLVDVPMILPGTVAAVVARWMDTRAPIVRPIFEGRRGHPVIFDRSVFGELKAAPLDAGARVVVRAHWADSVDVPVDDPGCVVDVDTPDDYRRLRS